MWRINLQNWYKATLVYSQDQSITSQPVLLLLHPVHQRRSAVCEPLQLSGAFIAAVHQLTQTAAHLLHKDTIDSAVRERERDPEHGSDFMSTEETSIRIWNMSALSHLLTPTDTQMLEYCRSAGPNCETLYCAFIQHFYITKVSFSCVIIYCAGETLRSSSKKQNHPFCLLKIRISMTEILKNASQITDGRKL